MNRRGASPRIVAALALAAVAVAVAAAVGAIAMAGEDERQPSNPGAGAGWSNVNRFPLEPRGEPVIEWTGEELVVFGGVLLGAGSGTRYTADGAIFDPSSNSWREVSASPAGVLAEPSATWTGRELLVMGTRCENALGHDEDVGGCEPGGLRIVALTPSTGSWRTVPFADELRRAPESGWPHFAGAAGDQVLVISGVAGRWLLEPDSGDVRSVPATGIDEDAMCAGGDRVVALDYEGESAHDQFPPNPVLAATVLDPSADRLTWSAVEPAPPDDRAWEAASLACAGDGAFVLRRSSDGQEAVNHFDGHRWRSVPPAPSPLGVTALVDAVWNGEELLVFTTEFNQPRRLLAYTPSTGEWSIAGSPRDLPARAVAAGDTLVIYSRTHESDMSLATVDV